MPYNYILDDSVRVNSLQNLENAIVIFDEAHNIAGSSEQSQSFDLTEDNLDETIEEIRQLGNLEVLKDEDCLESL
jgi:Rad3-related DNA helicase